MKTVLITSGGTIEPIDGVRGITNFATGKLGSVIAETLQNCRIFFVKNIKSAMPEIQSNHLTVIETTDTQSVQNAINDIMNHHHVDYFIHSMAISDYTVEKVVNINDIIQLLDENNQYSKQDIINLINNPPIIENKTKVSSSISQPLIYLKQTPKIIDSIKINWPHVKLIGFKLLNNVPHQELIDVAIKSLYRTDADFIVANDLTQITNDNHHAYIVNKNGIVFETHTKKELANTLNSIINSDKKIMEVL